MEKVATDIYTFAELRNNGFTYVDKTDILYSMASGEVGKLKGVATFLRDLP